MTNLWACLAQASQPTSTPAGRGPLVDLFIPLILVMGLYFFIVMRGSKRDQRKRDDMLKNVKRNDRVQTIGGVRGTVVEVRDDEIVVKVDEANNVKIRFARSAIAHVQADSPAPGNAAAKQ
ncbi:MAG: hypothetical protein CHACPFDD_03611 [Phycisphaerae bacterium]|nr:hypothetical protein [Phycisphaerae bacterium]